MHLWNPVDLQETRARIERATLQLEAFLSEYEENRKTHEAAMKKHVEDLVRVKKKFAYMSFMKLLMEGNPVVLPTNWQQSDIKCIETL